MTTRVDITPLLDALERVNPEALLLEPREVYDQAIVGLTCQPNDHWSRQYPSPWVAVYCRELAIAALTALAGAADTESEYEDNQQQAAEWVDYNSMGAWLGPHTPTWVPTHYSEDDKPF